MPEENVKNAETHLNKIQGEFQRLDDQFASKIADAEKQNFGTLVSQLNQERQAHNDRYSPFIVSAKERLEAAKEHETEANKEFEAKRQEVENRDKNRALKAWTQAGGDLSGFEAAWPEIRKAQLSESVLQRMKSEIRTSRSL